MADEIEYTSSEYRTVIRDKRPRSQPPTSRSYAYKIDAILYSHELGKRDLSPYLLDVSTVKGLGSPSGQWAFSFDRERGRLDPLLVTDDDWVTIGLRETLGGTDELVMFGAVDGARTAIKTDERTGATARTGRLVGRDFGKALETSDLLFNEFLQNAEPVIPGLIDPAKFRALTDMIHTGQLQAPGQTLYDLLVILVDDGFWYLPKSFGPHSLANCLAVESSVVDGNVIQLGTYVPEAATKLDQYLRGIFSTPFTELFYDLRPTTGEAHKLDYGVTNGDVFDRYGVQPTIVYRNLPFFEITGLSDEWFNLPSWYVSAAEVMDEDLGRSGAERFTLCNARGPVWSPSATLGAWGASGGRVPAFWFDKSEDSPIPSRPLAEEIARHGMRLLDLNDALAPLAPSNPETGERGPALQWLAQRTAALYQLYRNTPSTVAGTLRLSCLRPEIRMGHRVTYDEREYYVEQVEHAGRVDPRTGLLSGETTLTLMRGQTLNPAPAFTNPRPWRTK